MRFLKYSLSFVFVLVLAVILVPRFSSLAGTETNPIIKRDGNITQYANGVSKIEPTAFAISGNVRDMPTTVPDAEEKSARFVSRSQRKEMEKQALRSDKGYTPKQIAADEINRENAKRIKKTLPGAGAGEGKFQDPLVKSQDARDAPQAMPTPGLTFDGASQVDNASQGIGGVLPPDVNGDVGLNHYVSSVNLVFKIFNKNGTVAAGPLATSALFAALPAADPCRAFNDGDPVVVYDSLADRWHISQFAVPGNPNNFQCVAVSVTGDPTGAYYVWSYLYPNQIFNDYPKVGVWPDGYHMTFNQFNNAGTAFLGAGILTQDRAKALTGDPTASVVFTNIATIDPNAGGLLPTDMDGLIAPPAGMAQVIAEYRADEFGDPVDGIRYYKWVPNFTTPASSTLTVLPDVALAAFDARQPGGRGDIEQMGGANLDSISDRMMHRFAYRNLGTQAAPVNSFVGSFPVNVSGVNPTSAATYQTGIRWFEMRRTADAFTVFDQGTHTSGAINGATGLNNWMSGIAQDNDGNIAIGFSQSGSAQRADIKIAGRTNNVANSGTLNEGEAMFFAAAGSQTSTSNRWGDYSAMNVDPVDDCTFWYTQEYYASTGGAPWSTRVGRFVYPSCTPAQKATINGTVTFCSSGLPINQASVNATGGFNRITGAPGTYSMTVSPGTYTVSGSKSGGFTTASAPPLTVVDGQTATANFCLTGVAVLAPAAATLVSESCLPANGMIDPGETVTVSFGETNTGGANTTNDVGTLLATGGVTSPSGPQNYGVIVAGGPAVSRNFTFTADPALLCGTQITATIAHVDGATNLGNVTYSLPTGATGASGTTSYTGPAVAIPDNVPAGVNIPLAVSGVTGAVADLNFRFDADPSASCNASLANPAAAMDHTFVGDLVFKLTAPNGTSAVIVNQRGGTRENICNTLLDDDGGFPSLSTVSSTTGQVLSGNFASDNPLSVFDGINPNGTWTLNVADVAGVDVGSMRRFSLVITPRICANCAPASTVSVAGRVVSAAGNGVVNAKVSITNSTGQTRLATTSSFGYYRFDGVAVGETHTVAVSSKRYTYAPQVVNVTGAIANLNFSPVP
ncbi:MAG: carboxypeptidase regulatory-like domain-containing protein [Saprospiraceae bacterium]|nr:carboxypeptidase regulatory-like domain-containing protein [Pyrinomonadaceae bacterium]